ncbi:MAG: DUF6600 domain-containing protein, partial [Betaproteobacteria bacterium]
YPRTVAVDWVPYRDGSWTYVQPWGWTWVDNARWGWAPFHYGRWVREGQRWGWCPGTYVARPVYSPALVAWYGGAGGTSWSAGFNAGPTFGWVPLAWGEPYWPQYRHSTNYWRVVNRPYAVNVNRVPAKPLPTFSYANARIPGALTAVSSEVLAGRRQVGGNHYAIPPNALSGAALTMTPISLQPMRKPLAVDNLPRGIPPPASVLAGKPGALRPDARIPGSMNGQPFTGRAGPISEPAPGSGRPGPAAPQPYSGRAAVVEPAPAPTVGRPSPSPSEPAAFGIRPDLRGNGVVTAGPRTTQPGVVINDPRQSGGQSFNPGRPLPGRAPAAGPEFTRAPIRESGPYNPGLNAAPRNIAPAGGSIAPGSQSIAPAPYVAPAPQSIAPPPRPFPPQAPVAPIVRERAPAPAPAPYYAPSNSGQVYIPQPRAAPPVQQQPAPMFIPAPAPVPGPAPVQVRPVPGNSPVGGRVLEPQVQMPQAPGPGSR